VISIKTDVEETACEHMEAIYMTQCRRLMTDTCEHGNESSETSWMAEALLSSQEG
jgi:hypothetical protein